MFCIKQVENLNVRFFQNKTDFFQPQIHWKQQTSRQNRKTIVGPQDMMHGSTEATTIGQVSN